MKKEFPEVKFNDIDPLQEYFSDCNGDSWGVARLIDAAKDLQVFDCPLAALDLSNRIWQGCDTYDLAFHVKKVNAADLTQPIIIAWDGTIADGRHRIIKALSLGENTIKAVRMNWKPSPCKTADRD